MSLVVSKFGGSSMADAQAMRRSAEISLTQESSIVVVSATYGTTNKLIELMDKAVVGEWEDCVLIVNDLKEKHRAIARDLDCDETSMARQEELFSELESFTRGINLLKECSLRARDSFLALGERLSSNLFSQCLRSLARDKDVRLLDVRTVLRTDDQYSKALPNIEKIKELCQQNLSWVKDKNTVTVTQGFIGSNEAGVTTTLGRGGSDYSAALLAEGINAKKLEIWTDVAGIASTDPRICPEARPIPEISFKEAAEMAVFGAKILHPTTLTPALRADIGVFVGSSYEPQKGGTWIKKATENTPLVRSLALRRGQGLLTLSTPKMLHAHGFLFEIFKIFNDFKVSVDAITTSEISVSLTVDAVTLDNKLLLDELRGLCHVKVEESLALVSLIGNNINHTPGLARNIFDALGEINVRMICQGASLHNFCFLVDENQCEEAIKKLHAKFIEG